MTKKRSTARRLTAKERVLARWPKAYADNDGKGAWHILSGAFVTRLTWLHARTPAKAWADAASRLPKALRLEPRKCTWGDPMGGCQGHPDDCRCVQPERTLRPASRLPKAGRGHG